MKKLVIFLTASALLLLGSNAFAFDSTYFNLINAGGSQNISYVADGLTGEFEELGYDATTTSYIDVNGDIRDEGNANITSFIDLKQGSSDTQFLPSEEIGTTQTELDSEGISLTYQMSFTWDNLVGEITSGSLNPDGTLGSPITAKYTGGLIDFYVDDTLETPFIYDDGHKFATVTVTGGSYSVDITGKGAYEIVGNLTVLDEDFWMYYNSATDTFGDLSTWSDLYDIQFQMAWITAETQGDNNDVRFVPDVDPVTGKFAYKATTNHNSSIRLEVQVIPEPTTFLLFGFSLLGFAGVARRRS